MSSENPGFLHRFGYWRKAPDGGEYLGRLGMSWTKNSLVLLTLHFSDTTWNESHRGNAICPYVQK